MKSLLDRLKQIVDEQNLPGVGGQIGLIQASGASKAMVNHWLTGKVHTIAPRFAYKMEDNLGYRARWIMLGDGPEKVEASNIIQMSHPDPIAWGQVMELLELFRRADDRGRALMLGVGRDARPRNGDDSATINDE